MHSALLDQIGKRRELCRRQEEACDQAELRLAAGEPIVECARPLVKLDAEMVVESLQ